MSHLLKESTQGIGSLWKESAQGVSSLLREISTATSVVPGFTPRVDGASDPLPVLPRSTSAGEKRQCSITGGSLLHFFYFRLYRVLISNLSSPSQANKMTHNDQHMLFSVTARQILREPAGLTDEKDFKHVEDALSDKKFWSCGFNFLAF